MTNRKSVRLLGMTTLIIPIAIYASAFWAESGLPEVKPGPCPRFAIVKPASFPVSYWNVVVNYRGYNDVDGAQMKQTMDGKWSGSPWRLFSTLMLASWSAPSLLSPREFGWRLLIAWPLLTTESVERANYVSQHPETWTCNQQVSG